MVSLWSEMQMICIPYVPTDAIVNSSSLLQQNPEWFTFLVSAYPGCPGQKRPLNRCTVV